MALSANIPLKGLRFSLQSPEIPDTKGYYTSGRQQFSGYHPPTSNDTTICFATSGVKKKHVEKLNEFIEKFKNVKHTAICESKKDILIVPNVTTVNDINGSAKVLTAVSLGCKLISYDWVAKSLKKRKLQPHEDFIIPHGDHGVKTDTDLFGKKTRFMFTSEWYASSESGVLFSKKTLQKIVRCAGGTTASTDKKPFVVVGCKNDKNLELRRNIEAKRVCITATYILKCLMYMKIVQLTQEDVIFIPKNIKKENVPSVFYSRMRDFLKKN